MQDFRKLRVWHEAQKLADQVYGATKGFPPSQRFGLTDQACKAADSITHNISEGCGRATKGDKLKFFHIALGSVNEVDNCFVRANRLGYVLNAAYQPLLAQIVDVRKMMVSLINTVRRSAGER